jgi:RNA-binding motif X-linked protein 2
MSCRHQDTGKPRGFAFLAYEDQRSTVLAVDNLSGTKVGGRIITVDHVDNYKRKRAEVPPPSPPP